LTAVGKALGTPAYIAPEQIVGASNVGPSADLYSLGAILHTILTGKPPFAGKGVEDTLRMHLEAEPPRLPPSGGLEGLTARLLQKDPNARPKSAEAVIKLLNELSLDDAAPAIEPPTMVAPRARSSRTEEPLLPAPRPSTAPAPAAPRADPAAVRVIS